MIKTKELMLGNWVYAGAKTQFPMYVTGIFDDVAYLDFEGNEGDVWEEEEEDMFPVPLTEKIFNKNGFKCLSGVYYLGKCSNTEFCKDDDGYFYMTANLGEYKCIEKPIKYVHELQNLLTLAGVEINFKI